MLPGETIRSGGPATCRDCAATPPIIVHSSPGGYYIGTICLCGPYTRESDYYSTRLAAQTALDTNTVAWRS